MTIVRCIDRMPKEVVLSRTRIGRYNRTTVPEEARKFLDINENDEIEWVFENGRIIIKKRDISRNIKGENHELRDENKPSKTC